MQTPSLKTLLKTPLTKSHSTSFSTSPTPQLGSSMCRRITASVLTAVTAVLLLAPSFSEAFEDPTGGKPFLPWLWEDQFRPTIVAAGNRGSIGIFSGTIAATMVAHHYDQDVYQNFGHNQKWGSDVTKYGAVLGSGMPAIGVAVAQVFLDQENGLMHGRAIALTSLTHITTAFIANRERPNKSNRLSFPSGHAANAFTSATSLAYAYGPWVGIPAYGAATFIAVARMADDAHWISDTVAAAGLGIFWARASYLASLDKDTASIAWTPVIVPGGAVVSLSAEF